MSEYKIGDKVYLECEVFRDDLSDDTYKVRYTQYCDENAYTNWVNESSLHTADDIADESYNKGLNDAWELVKKIVKSPNNGGYTAYEFAEIFGISDNPVLDAYTPQEALAKVKEYEERNKINVGDVVKSKSSNIERIVTRVTEINIYCLFRDGSCGSYTNKNLEKIGEHFDSIDEFMRSTDD